jgi:hypothetical protein
LPVDATICVSPAALETSLPASTSGRPALSTKTSASSAFGLNPLPRAARTISGRHCATRGRGDDSSGARREEAAVETARGSFRERGVQSDFRSPRRCDSGHCRLGDRPPLRGGRLDRRLLLPVGRRWAECDDPRDDERQPGSRDERLESAKLPARTRQVGDQLGHRNPFLGGLRG